MIIIVNDNNELINWEELVIRIYTIDGKMMLWRYKLKYKNCPENIVLTGFCWRQYYCPTFLRRLISIPYVLPSPVLLLISRNWPSHFYPDTIHKSLWLTKILTYKDLKPIPHNKNYIIDFELLFIKVPPEQYLLVQENSSKKNSIEIFNSKYDKMIFALLNEIITIHMWLILLYIKDFGFKKYFSVFI